MPDCVSSTQSTSFLPWFPQRMCVVENQCRTNIPSLHPQLVLSIILPALFTRPIRSVQCLLASEHRITLVTTGPSDHPTAMAADAVPSVPLPTPAPSPSFWRWLRPSPKVTEKCLAGRTEGRHGGTTWIHLAHHSTTVMDKNGRMTVIMFGELR